MKFLRFLEIFLKVIPAFVFFISFRVNFDIVIATKHLVISVLVSNFIYFLVFRRLKRDNIMILLGATLFALPTILLNDPMYIKAKGVIVNTTLATVLLLSKFIFKKNLISLVLPKKIECDENVMHKVCIMWTVFLYCAAILNYFVAFALPTLFNLTAEEADNIWVYFRTISPPILNSSAMLFTLHFIYKRDPFVQNKVRAFFKREKAL